MSDFGLKFCCDTCKFSHLTTIIVLLNFQIVHGWTNESVDDLLAFLHDLLPPKSTFPTKQRECKTQISKLGLGYEKHPHMCEWLRIISQKSCK